MPRPRSAWSSRDSRRRRVATAPRPWSGFPANTAVNADVSVAPCAATIASYCAGESASIAAGLSALDPAARERGELIGREPGDGACSRIADLGGSQRLKVGDAHRRYRCGRRVRVRVGLSGRRRAERGELIGRQERGLIRAERLHGTRRKRTAAAAGLQLGELFRGDGAQVDLLQLVRAERGEEEGLGRARRRAARRSRAAIRAPPRSSI